MCDDPHMQIRTYWTYQLLGWSLYAALGFVLNVIGGAPVSTMIVTHSVFIACSIVLTHGLRSLIRRHRFGTWPRVRKWAMLTLAVIAISAIQTAIIVAADFVVEGDNAGPWSLVALLALWWGMTLATSSWTGLYLKITAQRQQNEMDAQMRLALRDAQLRALETQVNPHFLFNCLNSVRALVTIDPPRAQDMVTRLANVMRHSLRHDNEHTVALATEVEAVSDYLALEAVRFEDRLRVQLTIDPEAETCFIPPMLLQTLVENAIKHGVSQVTDRGELIVRAARQDGNVKLEVENTGQLSESSNGMKLGLANARERLRLLYGDRASLSLRNGTGSVTATVLIPAA
jgi:hypothetical protein